MEGHIQKWGNSLGVRIPMQLAKKLKLHPGTLVSIEVINGQIVIRSKYNLDAMLEMMNPDNFHGEQFDNDQVGNEEW